MTAGSCGKPASVGVPEAGHRRNRLLGPDQAAEHLEIRAHRLRLLRRRAVDHIGQLCRQPDLPAPHGQHAAVPRGDVEALLDLPGVDWEAVRAARPGEPSPAARVRPAAGPL